MKRILMIATGVVLLAAFAVAAGTTTPVTYRWTKPTTGSPVVTYEVYTSTNNGTTWALAATEPDTTATIPLTYMQTYLVRVRGVDAQNRVGAYSPASDPFMPDAGAPGASGKPIRVP